MIRLKDVTVRFDRAVVLRDVFFRLEARERVGLIGANGSGKTTLLRLLLREVEPAGGAVEAEEGVRIGYFSQFSELSGAACAQEILEDVEAEAIAAEEELAKTSSALEREDLADDAMSALLARQFELLEHMEHTAAWDYPNRIDTVLTKLGFSDDDRLRPIEELSGGWRNRAALARLLLEAPDVLLLDEPTNYLDLEALAWLESWFANFSGGAIVVSHDRHFLDQVVTRIVEIESARLHDYSGGYSAYVQERNRKAKQLERLDREERELLAYEAEAIDDRRELAKNPSKTLRRRLATAKRAGPPREVDTITTHLYSGLHVGDSLLRVENLGKARDAPLFAGLDFELAKGERLGVVGPNGCGKSTLLHVLEGIEEPDNGRVVLVGVTELISYETERAELDFDDTTTHAINTAPLANLAPRKHVHRFLELLGITEIDVKRPIRALSGGQQARVVLARCLLSGAGVLLLDEPTNHLDVRSARAMELALASFPGAVVVVSHDRFFLDKVATRLLVFTETGIDLADTTWSAWQARATTVRP